MNWGKSAPGRSDSTIHPPLADKAGSISSNAGLCLVGSEAPALNRRSFPLRLIEKGVPVLQENQAPIFGVTAHGLHNQKSLSSSFRSFVPLRQWPEAPDVGAHGFGEGQDVAVARPSEHQYVTCVVERDSGELAARQVKHRRAEEPGIPWRHPDQQLSGRAKTICSQGEGVNRQVALNIDVLFRAACERNPNQTHSCFLN